MPVLGAATGGTRPRHHVPAPKPRRRSAPRKPKLGHSVLFHPRTKARRCRLRGALPDPACTPGAYYPRATRRLICRTGYTALVRDVAESTKNAVYREYGIRHHRPGQYEVDHLVPLELGGSSSIANLFPSAAGRGQDSARRTSSRTLPPERCATTADG